MAGEDDDKTPKSGPRQSRGRRTRTPVTIDLKAEPTPPEPKDDKSAKAPISEKTPDAKPPEKPAGAAAAAAAANAEPPPMKSGPADAPKPAPAKAEPAKSAPPAAKSEPAKSEPPKSDAGAKAPPPPPPPPPQPPRNDPPRGNRPPGASIIGSDDSLMRPALAGAAGGVVTFLLLLALQGIGLLPAPGRGAANEATTAAKAATEAVAGMERRLSAVEMITQDMPAKTAIDGLDGRIAALEQGQGSYASKADVEALAKQVEGAGGDSGLREELDALKTSVSDLSGKMDALGGISAGDLADLKDRVSKLEIGGSVGDTVDASAVTALSGRIDSLQDALKAVAGKLATLESAANKGDDANATAAKAIAVMTLRGAAEGDAPFATDLDLAAALGLDSADITALRPLAEKGAPTAATLAERFPPVGDAIIAATSAPDPDANFFERVMASVGGLVTVRPAGPMDGDDPQAIVSRMRAAVDAGNLDAALKEREQLPEAGKAASAEWAAAAEDRAKIDALVDSIAASVTGKPPA